MALTFYKYGRDSQCVFFSLQESGQRTNTSLSLDTTKHSRYITPHHAVQCKSKNVPAQDLGLNAYLPAELGMVYFPAPCIRLTTEAHAQALAQAAKSYFVRKGGRKGAWVDLAAEAASVTVYDTAIALMARGCGGPVALRNLMSDPAALVAKLAQAPAPQRLTTLQGLADASWAP